jgi:hypothetical protein
MFWNAKPVVIILALVLSTSVGLAQGPGAATGLKKAPLPSSGQRATARKQVKALYAEDLRAAKTQLQIWNLARKIGEAAGDSRNDADSTYALSFEAIDLYIASDDLLSAFRLVDDLASKIEINVVSQKLDLFKRIAKETKSVPVKRMLAVIGLRLGTDFVSTEDYAAAKDVVTRSVDLAKVARDQVVAERATVQLERVTGMLNNWQDVVAARQRLMMNERNMSANETVGRYLCFVRQDWDAGLPKLALSGSIELRPVALKDLATPRDAEDMAVTAEVWWDIAQKKNETERKQILPRVAYWYEKALPNLTGLAKVTAEKRLEVAYTTASARDFSKLLLASANGLRPTGVVDCTAKCHPVKIGSTFDVRKSWLMSFEFQPPNLDPGTHMVFCWGDLRPGKDPIHISTDGGNLHCIVEDTVSERGQGITAVLSPDQVGKWVNVKLVHDAVNQELDLYIDHRLVRRDPLAILPRADQKMIASIGGINDGDNLRFKGRVRDIWLGNIK